MKTVLFLTLLTAAANAGTVYVVSDALDTTNNSANPTLDVIPAPLWAPALPDSDWISYASTGDLLDYSPAIGTIVDFTTEFTLTGAITGGRLEVLADDSATVFLNGHALSPDYVCSPSHPGCAVSSEIIFDFLSFAPYLTDGSNTLTIAVEQLTSGPYGLDFRGDIHDSGSTPEPSSIAGIAGGLICLYLLRGRK
jgi:hypothetical protein